MAPPQLQWAVTSFSGWDTGKYSHFLKLGMVLIRVRQHRAGTEAHCELLISYNYLLIFFFISSESDEIPQVSPEVWDISCTSLWCTEQGKKTHWEFEANLLDRPSSHFEVSGSPSSPPGYKIFPALSIWSSPWWPYMMLKQKKEWFRTLSAPFILCFWCAATSSTLQSEVWPHWIFSHCSWTDGQRILFIYLFIFISTQICRQCPPTSTGWQILTAL